MHPLFSKADSLTGTIIKAAIEVHREMGPGLLETIYEKCLQHELQSMGLEICRQEDVPIHYKGFTFTHPLQFDVLVARGVLVEIKAVKELAPITKAQVLSYLRLLDLPIGLLINFHEERLVDGVCRLMLPHAKD